MATFSIIVPVYNYEKYLKKCLDSIDSIAEKTFPYFEALLVDNGSKDTSKHICDEFAFNDKRFRVLYITGGVSHAINYGLE